MFQKPTQNPSKIENLNFNNSTKESVTFWEWFNHNSIVLYSAIVIILGFFTFFQGYANPQSLYWDENYHVSSAERYLQGKLFMEPHPPLGKLIIAMGEKIINPNASFDKSSELLIADDDKMIPSLATGDAKDDSIPHITSIPGKKEKKDGITVVKKIGTQNVLDANGKAQLDSKGQIMTTDVNEDVYEYKTSFLGYRFFPAFSAWLCSFLLFWLLFKLLGNQHLAFLFTLPYIFDNAMVVHSRGAMLDGIQMFFTLSALIWFVKMWNEDRSQLYDYAIYGLLLGLNVATKLNGMILIIPPIALFLKESFGWNRSIVDFIIQKLRLVLIAILAFYVFHVTFGAALDVNLTSKITDILKDNAANAKLEYLEKEGLITAGSIIKLVSAVILGVFVYFTNSIMKMLELNNLTLDYTDFRFVFNRVINWVSKSILIGVIALFVFFSSYYVHFAIAKTLVPGNEYKGYISQEHLRVIEKGETGLITNFFVQMADHQKFASKFQDGVPKLDLTKGDSENGSSPLTWPLGNKSIRYSMKWDPTNCKSPDYNNDTCKLAYIYLIPNIFAWGLCLLGILLCAALIIAKLFFGVKIKDKNLFGLMLVFFIMYSGYMFQIAGIDRVLYLYHYFIPLIFSLIATALLFQYLTLGSKWRDLSVKILIVVMCIVVLNFLYFSPFTYQLNLSPREFAEHNWFKFWNLKRQP